MGDEYKKSFYKKYFSTYYSMFLPKLETGFEYYVRYFRKNYAKYIPKDKDARILEIGCGVGLFLNYLRKEGYKNVVGVDICEENINLCVPKGFNVVRADIFDFLTGKKEKFEYIVMNYVIEHFSKEEILDLLNLINNSLSPGGIVTIETNNVSNPFTGSITRYMDFTHEISFTEESLAQILINTGFCRVQIQPNNIYVSRNILLNIAGMGMSMALQTLFRFALCLNGIKTARILTPNMIGIASKQDNEIYKK